MPNPENIQKKNSQEPEYQNEVLRIIVDQDPTEEILFPGLQMNEFGIVYDPLNELSPELRFEINPANSESYYVLTRRLIRTLDDDDDDEIEVEIIRFISRNPITEANRIISEEYLIGMMDTIYDTLAEPFTDDIPNQGLDDMEDADTDEPHF